MYLQGKYIYDLTAEDLENLITNEVKEGINLEYKKNINIEGEKVEDNRQEFFCDIAAMYNSSGGCIIYGIDEKRIDKKTTGYPEKFVHQEIKSQDKLEQLIHSLLNSNTDPSITNVAIKFITVQECLVMVIGIPRGLGYPSMVTFRDMHKFFRRNSSGRYAVYTSELNQMFMQSQTIKERAENFRNDRIGLIFKGVSINRNYPEAYIHLIPFGFLEDKMYNIIELSRSHTTHIFPYYTNQFLSQGFNSFNVDGLISEKRSDRTNEIRAHTQYFRNGIIEAFFRLLDNGEKGTTILGPKLLHDILNTISRGMVSLSHLQVEPPIMVFISLRHIQSQYLQRHYNGESIGSFVKDNVIIPGVMFSTLEKNIDKIFGEIKPYLDIIYQAAGGQECQPLNEIKMNSLRLY